MKGMMYMRTTLNLSEQLVREVEALHGSENRSRAVEKALTEAVRQKKLRAFMELKGQIAIDEDAVKNLRKAELKDNENHS